MFHPGFVDFLMFYFDSKLGESEIGRKFLMKVVGRPGFLQRICCIERAGRRT